MDSSARPPSLPPVATTITATCRHLHHCHRHHHPLWCCAFACTHRLWRDHHHLPPAATATIVVRDLHHHQSSSATPPPMRLCLPTGWLASASVSSRLGRPCLAWLKSDQRAALRLRCSWLHHHSSSFGVSFHRVVFQLFHARLACAMAQHLDLARPPSLATRCYRYHRRPPPPPPTLVLRLSLPPGRRCGVTTIIYHPPRPPPSSPASTTIHFGVAPLFAPLAGNCCAAVSKCRAKASTSASSSACKSSDQAACLCHLFGRRRGWR
jgi:hypothetical protein